MFSRFVFLSLLTFWGPAVCEVIIRAPLDKDWSQIMESVRAKTGVPDISKAASRKTGVWRFSYIHSMALESPNIITVQEQADGTARVLVTTENREFFDYRINEDMRRSFCEVPEAEAMFSLCPPPSPAPTGPEYNTVELTASPDDLARLRALFASVPVCEQPEAPPKSSMGLDGSDWIFELADGGRYCMAHRWSPHEGSGDPNGGAFNRLGLYMALLAQGHVFPM